MKPSTTVQFSPSRNPSVMNSVFHSPEPMSVSSRKRPRFMRSTPAGIDTRLRTIGTNRPVSTATLSCRPNHTIALSTSSELMSGTLSAQRRRRATPT